MTGSGNRLILALVFLQGVLLVGALDVWPWGRAKPFLSRQPAQAFALARQGVARSDLRLKRNATDCDPQCKAAEEAWKAAEDAQTAAVKAQTTQVENRFSTEATALEAQVKAQVEEEAAHQVKAFESEVENYLNTRSAAFNTAVESRHHETVALEEKKFEQLKAHQGQVLEGLAADVVDHGYATAKQMVEEKAKAAAAGIDNNPKLKAALASLTKANEEWVKTYVSTGTAANNSYASWEVAHSTVEGPWNNITQALDKANNAAIAARGLGPDTRWAHEVVRVSGDVVQAAHTEAMARGSEADAAYHMAMTASQVVKGNSGNIKILTDLLDKAEQQAASATQAADR